MNSLHNLTAHTAEPITLTSLAWQTFPAACRTKLEALKHHLVSRFTAEFPDLQGHLVHQAVEEADALASLTVLPHLFLPTLAEEKVQHFRDWNDRQQLIYQRGALALAA